MQLITMHCWEGLERRRRARRLLGIAALPWADSSTLGWWSVCRAVFLKEMGWESEGGGFPCWRLSIKKAEAWLGWAGRPLSWVCCFYPLSIKSVMDRQPQVMPLGWKTGRRVPLGLEIGNSGGGDMHCRGT